jgi:flagellar protein FlbD
MILLHRLEGPSFALNSDLIERAEATPETVVTLVDGTRYVVAETLDEVVARIHQSRASVIAMADMVRLDHGQRPAGLRLLTEDAPEP